MSCLGGEMGVTPVPATRVRDRFWANPERDRHLAVGLIVGDDDPTATFTNANHAAGR